MKALSSAGVETTPLDAHATLGLSDVVTCWSSSPGATA
jgi:hypothetical protein